MRRILRTLAISLIAIPIGLAVSLCNADVASYVARRVNLFNGEWITSVNAAGTGTSNIIRSNSSNYTDINTTGGFINFLLNGVSESFITADAFYFDSGTSFRIASNSGDGADNTSICVGAGGVCNRTRSGTVTTYGNEVASVGGNVEIATGDSGSDSFTVYQGSTLKLDLATNATFSTDIAFSGAGNGVANITDGAVTAAGTTIADAYQLTASFSMVGGGSGGGVKLVDLGVGELQYVRNSSGGNITVYPNASGAFIQGKGAGVGATVASNQSVLCFQRTAGATGIHVCSLLTGF